MTAQCNEKKLSYRRDAEIARNTSSAVMLRAHASIRPHLRFRHGEHSMGDCSVRCIFPLGPFLVLSVTKYRETVGVPNAAAM